MPLTPFHLGPALLLGLIFLRYVDLPTFIVANVIVDIEPMFILVFNLGYSHHQFFHTFLGGTIVALVIAWIMNRIRGKLSPLLLFFKIEQKPTFTNILIASVFGTYIHILLDSWVHGDVKPFFPLDVNPFLNESMSSTLGVYMLCIWSFIGGLIVYSIRTILIRRKAMNSRQ